MDHLRNQKYENKQLKNNALQLQKNYAKWNIYKWHG